jgi:type IV pilus assembly protein PilY1
MKNSIKAYFILVLFLFFLVPITPHAKDTDLYMASGEGVEPNILVMFDNSGSMNEEIQVYFYDPNILYNPLVVPQLNRNTVYYRTSGGAWSLFANSINDVACSAARTALTNNGHYEGNTNSSCTRTSRTLRTGNYRNYLETIGGDEFVPKLTVAKKVIEDFLNTINGVRIGMMVFNRVVNDNSEGGRIHSTIKSLDDAGRNQLITDVKAIVAETWTPLAETLYEAGRYFKGGSSYFNPGVVYTSPIQYYCQRNYVIIITDGKPTRDQNAILASAIGDQDGDRREPIGAPNDPNYADRGSDYLDDVAKYLYDKDLRTDLTGQQNIITYTIGFTEDNSLLERTATHGHGRYFYTDNAQQLAGAFQNIVSEILEKTSSFVAPIVPVSRMERTSAGDKIYLALFQPNLDQMWSGNIKKFGVVQSGAQVGQITDIKGLAALDDNGQILETSYSYWPSPIPENRMDGADVEKGGVGDILMNRDFSTNPRKIYTYLGSNANLTQSSNAFNNTNITPSMLGLGVDSDPTAQSNRDKLVRFVQGFDAYDDNGNNNFVEKREWILGAFLHSRPSVIHYETRSVIFAGGNDGMFHAFDDETGEELWAFIPPDLLNKLQALHQDVLESFVDGSPRAYISHNENGSINQAILIFGERRGGNHYYALDVTNPLAPQFIWKISPTIAGFSELGQTWSTPNIGKVTIGAEDKYVAFIGGGYDENQDNDPLATSDTKGRAIYIVDILNGSLIKRFSVSDPGYSSMTYSIPSDIANVDTDGNGKIDRLYVGDMGGRMWRFDIADSNTANWTGKIIFNSNPGRDGTTGRKIFYPPDVTLEKEVTNYEMLFFGTGDREHPKEATVINRLYAVKDKNPSTALTEQENDLLVDITQDLLQNPSTSQEDKNAILEQLRTGNGWFIKLDSTIGEKSLSPPVVFNKIAYFTTFSPTSEGAGGDPCYVGEGTGKVYILQYNTGNAMFNLDLTNDIGGPIISRADRSKIIGTAIPSTVVITFIGGKAIAYIGVGGGVSMPPITGKQNEQKYWKIVF